MKTILITGTSSGFGFLTAETLVKKGYTVLATMRDPAGRNHGKAETLNKLAADSKGTLHVLELDVTDEASVERAVTKALELAGSIDAAVNNAGVGTIGQSEAFTVEQFRQCYDINVFGVQRVNRAVLPHMRERGSGLLVHVSSALGRIVMPFFGAYISSKFALEALAQSYRYELAATGVDSVIVEPGGYATEFVNSLIQPGDPARVNSYGPLADVPQKMWDGLVQGFKSANAPSPQLVADAIVTIIATPTGQRPLRTTVVSPMMESGLKRINTLQDEIQSGMLQGAGLGDMLSPKEK